VKNDIRVWPLLAIPISVLAAVGYLAWTEFAPTGRGIGGGVGAEASQSLTLSKAELDRILATETLPISEAEASSINAARPVDVANLVPSKPFVLPPTTAAQSSDALLCLTQAIYYEAANESDMGQRAVAQVVLNRMRNRAFPKSVCGVVYQGSERSTGCQFSFTCDGSLARTPSRSGWARAQRHAAAALNGWVERSVGLATHYHADYVVPYWASSLDKARTIGTHLFYVMRGAQRHRNAFNGRYDATAEHLPGNKLAETVAEALEDVGIPVETAAAPPPLPPVVLPSNIREDSRGSLNMPEVERSGEQQSLPRRLRADDAARPPVVDENAGILLPGK
jgi:spore germination cell wall hydrolase CwlJ-like protein